MQRRAARIILLTIAIAALGCAPAPARKKPRPASSWQAIATPEDRGRLHLWRTAWMDGLRQARASGAGDRIAATGALLDPDAALSDVAFDEGRYLCRTYKLGAQSADRAAFLALPAQPCRYADGRFALVFGPQRPAGRVFADEPGRMIFLGAMSLGDEPVALAYGRDRVRDMIGLVERVGDHRWRLVLPRPRWESQIDVIEIVPTPDH